VGVEPDPTHFRWLIKHFKDNDINDQHHHLIEGAVGIEDGEAFLSMAVDPAADYGQRVFASVEEANRHGIANTIPVRTYALSTLLSRFDVVDLVDMDIQGTELEVVSAAHDQLTSKVKRINVGTHSHDIEKGLRKLLGISGWHCEADYSCLGNRRTPYGEITFGDGTQTWVNPKFSESHP
jgi:FkbM family methyltransferase